MNTHKKLVSCHICAVLFEKSIGEINRTFKKRGVFYCLKCRSVRHNMSKSPEYKSWGAMKTRCDNPTHNAYARYGGRGVTYQKEWASFENFLKDMGVKPDPEMELDRIDNEKNYCKENCRWATRKEQTRNRGGKRATRLYTFNGKTLCIADWAKEIGISNSSLQKRLNKGWPLEIALSPEKRTNKKSSEWINYKGSSVKGKLIRRKNSKYITIGEETKTYAEWEKEKNLSRGLISRRLSKGLSEYEAVMNPVRK
jgi:hypothetical protein